MGSETSDDAGVFRLRADLAVVNTADFFPPMVDDPYAYGQIAASNALSDVFAMGGKVATAVNLLGYPADRFPAELISEILRGGAERIAAAGGVLVGGHTVDDAELKYGLAVTGVVHPDRVVKNRGARKGDVLVLTKPLGTGIVATGIKRGAVDDHEEESAIASMVALNDIAGGALSRFSARACTDVTGFGLAGHGAEMVPADGSIRLEFDADAIGLLPGTARLAEAGFTTGGSRRTRDFLGKKLSISRNVEIPVQEAVVDPQTSGGLLVSLPARQASGFVEYLRKRGLRPAVVGRVGTKKPRSPILVSIE